MIEAFGVDNEGCIFSSRATVFVKTTFGGKDYGFNSEIKIIFQHSLYNAYW